ncbi:uncharacterized protein LOC108906321 isoform X6 [Anoplophora glabripennis]|uniref:uncharacterized protein LOC108906321 isoform X6 n=1 Tax=Anoplophora glabripennis TaxID=217634 RepID=UPI000C75EE32|nr:uncharacterized protein LOC108906321 isoform X6 [Anoplophora glabripennis]
MFIKIRCTNEGQKKRVEKIHIECQADPKTQVDEELLKRYYKGEQFDKSLLGAHMFCMVTKFGVLDEDGKIIKSTLKTTFSRFISDETKLNEAMEKCAVEKNDHKDTALDLVKCFREESGLSGPKHIHDRF